MPKQFIDRRVFTDLSWWHWALTVPLLAAHLAGSAWAMPAAMLLCGAVGGYFLIRLKKIRPYPVQVRVAYLAMLAAGMLPGMQFLHWIQLVGTTARITVGYCALLRMLSLAPFNRTQPLTAALIGRALFREPCYGGLVQWQEEAVPPKLGCCSLPRRPAPMSCSLKNFQSPRSEKNHAQAH